MLQLKTHQAFFIGALGLTLITSPGCDKDTKKDSAGSTAKPVAAAAVDLGGINAAVPDGMQLSFVSQSLKDNVEAVVPSGWEASKIIPGSYRPPQGSKLGFFTKFKVGTNCDGMCSKKAWAEVVAKSEFGQLDDATLLKDEKVATGSVQGRIVVAEAGDRVRIIAAWWKPGSSHYVYCRAELDGKARDAVDAFEQACRSTRW